MKERVIRNGKVVRIYAKSGYLPHVNGKVMCKLETTGNGYIAKFKSFSSAMQDNYVCLDYSEASLLFKAMSAFSCDLLAEDK